MSTALHPLAERYLDLIDDTPDELRARRGPEVQAASTLTGGKHVVIRGLWRSGKRTFLAAVLRAACDRTGGAAFTVSLADPTQPDGRPRTAAAALGRAAAKVNEFLAKVGAGAELRATPERPFEPLGELAAPLFVGATDLAVLEGLGAADGASVLEALLTTPKNVRVAAVALRHRALDPLFDGALLPRAGLEVELGPILDDELVELVNTPAQAAGVQFTNEALGALAEATASRPWELVSLCHAVAARLPPTFRGDVRPDDVDALLDLDALGATAPGSALVETYVRILASAFPDDQRQVIDMLALGTPGEASATAVSALEARGWIVSTDQGVLLTSGLMDLVARAIAGGEIRVKVEA
jgi:hypothetical protein